MFLKSRSNSKVKGLRSWYHFKGLARRITYVEYGLPSTYQSNVMTKVIVLKSRYNSKAKRQRVKVMLSNERYYHMEYTCET
jgi:hypothetical protein